MRCVDAFFELASFLRDSFAACDSYSPLEWARIDDHLLDILRNETSKATPAPMKYRAWLKRKKIKERIEQLQNKLELMPIIREPGLQTSAKIGSEQLRYEPKKYAVVAAAWIVGRDRAAARRRRAWRNRRANCARDDDGSGMVCRRRAADPRGRRPARRDGVGARVGVDSQVRPYTNIADCASSVSEYSRGSVPESDYERLKLGRADADDEARVLADVQARNVRCIISDGSERFRMPGHFKDRSYDRFCKVTFYLAKSKNQLFSLLSGLPSSEKHSFRPTLRHT